jgi:hypothetical protein
MYSNDRLGPKYGAVFGSPYIDGGKSAGYITNFSGKNDWKTYTFQIAFKCRMDINRNIKTRERNGKNEKKTRQIVQSQKEGRIVLAKGPKSIGSCCGHVKGGELILQHP